MDGYKPNVYVVWFLFSAYVRLESFCASQGTDAHVSHSGFGTQTRKATDSRQHWLRRNESRQQPHSSGWPRNSTAPAHSHTVFVLAGMLLQEGGWRAQQNLAAAASNSREELNSSAKYLLSFCSCSENVIKPAYVHVHVHVHVQCRYTNSFRQRNQTLSDNNGSASC